MVACPLCGQICKGERGVKIHIAKTLHAGKGRVSANEIINSLFDSF